MSKYIDAEKLIAEIERRMKTCAFEGTRPNQREWETLLLIKKFITSLQQEQPEVDLEKAFAHEYAIYHLPDFIIASIVNGTELIDFIYKTARHFAEWGATHINARKEDTK